MWEWQICHDLHSHFAVSPELSEKWLPFFCCHICRKVADRPRDPAKWNEIADVVSALSIPVIANGDVFDYDDFGRIRAATGS